MKYLAKTRSLIMGLSMCMIAFFHTTDQFSSFWDSIKNFGDFGVNLFFCISGMTMVFVWNKNQDIKVFLWNRIMRILVPFLPIVIVWCLLSYLIHECSLQEAIFKICTIQFWVDGNLLHWFVSGILVLYIVTPGWMISYQKNRKLTMVLTIFLCVVCCILPYYWGYAFQIKCFLQRVPTYFMGIAIGKLQMRETKESSIFYAGVGLLFLLGIILLILMDFSPFVYSWKYLMYDFMTVPILFLLSELCHLFQGSWFGRGLAFLGTLTLETYLIQQKLLKVGVGFWNRKFAGIDPKLHIFNIIVFIFTIIISYYYHGVTEKIYRRIHKSS